MTPNEKRLPNFEKLTKALNERKSPYRSLRSLRTLVLICEPAVNSVHNCEQETKVCVT